jgi:hypothetical protein
MAKVLFYQEDRNVTKVAKVIKTVNYLNRLLIQQESDFLLGKKKVAGKETHD